MFGKRRKESNILSKTRQDIEFFEGKEGANFSSQSRLYLVQNKLCDLWSLVNGLKFRLARLKLDYGVP
jgi:hypothetical protein